MAYDERLVNRIREALAAVETMDEKAMFGGVCFMVDGKMCVGVVGSEMMCRIGSEKMQEALEKPGCREMDFTGRAMSGFVFVDEYGMNRPADLKYWIDLCLKFNPKAKAAKKKGTR